MAKKKPRRRKNPKAGGILRQFRLKSGKTLSQVAQEVGCSIGNVSGWERGITAIPVKNIDRVASAYGLTEEKKSQYIEFVYSPLEDSPELSTESQVFCGWLALPEESRRRILRAMNAYENPPQE